ncbi:MAG: restriction endonuclease subunit S [Candidatus Gracilibacteria bacterium]|nr:restriction endonuclease subunit S [Candidatus Gracilibacteria bacterium]
MLSTFLLPYEKLKNRWDPKSYAFLRAFGKTNFEFIKIGKLLTNNRENISLEDEKLYKQITIKIYHKGVILRGEQKGKDIKTRPQFKVKAGQFILSKIDAKDGAFGIIPDYLDGGIITGSFVSFDNIDQKKLDINYFDVLLSQDFFLNILKSKSVGTTGRKPIMIDEFLDLEIPLPPLEIQEKIVKTYNDIKNEIVFLENENQNLEKEVDIYLMKELGIEIEQKEKKKFFCVGYEDLERWDINFNLLNEGTISNKYNIFSVKDISSGAPLYGSNKPSVSGNKEKDYRYIRITDIDDKGNLRDDVWVTVEKFEEKYVLKENDFLIARTGGTIGKTFLYKEAYGKAVYAGYLIKFLLDENKIVPELLYEITKTSYYNNWLRTLERFAGQPNINSKEFLSFSFPLPNNLDLQIEILNGINNIKNKSKIIEERIEKLKIDLDEKIKRMILEGKDL